MKKRYRKKIVKKKIIGIVFHSCIAVLGGGLKTTLLGRLRFYRSY
jgi:hypothetical protein